MVARAFARLLVLMVICRFYSLRFFFVLHRKAHKKQSFLFVGAVHYHVQYLLPLNALVFTLTFSLCLRRTLSWVVVCRDAFICRNDEAFSKYNRNIKISHTLSQPNRYIIVSRQCNEWQNIKGSNVWPTFTHNRTGTHIRQISFGETLYWGDDNNFILAPNHFRPNKVLMKRKHRAGEHK